MAAFPLNQNPNPFQKPATITFTFQQRHNKYDASGVIVDSTPLPPSSQFPTPTAGGGSGGTIYRLVNRGDERSMRWLKDYPLDVLRAQDGGSLAATVKWGVKAKGMKVEGLAGRGAGGGEAVWGGILDER